MTGYIFQNTDIIEFACDDLTNFLVDLKLKSLEKRLSRIPNVYIFDKYFYFNTIIILTMVIHGKINGKVSRLRRKKKIVSNFSKFEILE